MNPALTAEIENFLLLARCWVTSEELRQVFGLADDRALRRCGDKPGLCSLFAISGDKGFKHVAHASPLEWERFSERIRAHGISELSRLKALRETRARITRQLQHPPITLEKATGQALLAIPQP
jgi:hypothetical protein